MYFKRKMDETLVRWLKSENHSPAVVFGIRQCGKSETILHFAKSNFKNVVSIDFWKNPSACEAFNDSLEVDDIIKKLSYIFQKYKFVPYETIIVLDEIQDCPRARLALKSFKSDKRFEVIASGSYLGLNIDNSGVPKPNGSEDFFEMKTMDFEEFLWANGYDETMINPLVDCFVNKKPVPSLIHDKMKELFKEYICVGGYPEAVLKFVKTNSFSQAYDKVKDLIIDIKGDPSKRKDTQNKPLYTSAEVSRIQKAFELIASFSVKDNKRFVLSNIKGNSYQREDAINYMINASIAYKVNNVSVPSLPLGVKKIESDFKLFYSDIGILINQLGFETIQGIMEDTLGMNKGYIYESVVADSLYKASIPLYYFSKSSGLEIDFVIPYKGFSTLIEAKAKTGNSKASKTVMSHKEHYGETKLIKIGDYNISQEGDIITIPHYMTFVLGK